MIRGSVMMNYNRIMAILYQKHETWWKRIGSPAAPGSPSSITTLQGRVKLVSNAHFYCTQVENTANDYGDAGLLLKSKAEQTLRACKIHHVSGYVVGFALACLLISLPGLCFTG